MIDDEGEGEGKGTVNSTPHTRAIRAYRYPVNAGFGTRRDLNPQKTDQFSAQIGLRLDF